jgi:endo-1,4-beta-xylanase
MKFAAVQPGRHVYTFQDADTIVAFARAHGMQVRGHNLVWYKVLPSWLTDGNFSRQEAMTILHDHISTVVSHYRGQVSDWDVVNEGLNYDGTLLNSFWLQTIGPNYIDLAFRWAHEADPQARLFYNDYGGEGLGRKSDAIYNLVKDLRQRGVPINGVGLQMHVSLDATPDPQDVLTNMKRLTALGVEVQITEMDVETQDDPRSLPDKLTAEANLYRNMLSACLAAPNCTAFLMWGFTDRYSWIPYFTGHPDMPLIFDTSYRPKPAYNALIGVLAESTRRKRPSSPPAAAIIPYKYGMQANFNTCGRIMTSPSCHLTPGNDVAF